LVLLVLLGLSIEFWYVTVPVLAVLIFVAVAASSRSERRGSDRLALGPSQEAERQALLRRVGALALDPSPRSGERRYRARCDWCGAPRWHGADACRYCGRSLVLG
jgi:hypothetical protein